MPGPIDISQDVAAPAAVVWALITDIENSPDVISGIDSVQRLDDNEEFGVGTRWRETRTMFGKSASEEMTVTAVEAGRSYTTEAQHGKAHYTSSLRVEPKGEGADSWHADNTYMETPTMGSILQAHQLPEVGGGQGRMKTGYHLRAEGDAVTRVGLTIMQAFGLPTAGSWGTESNHVTKAFTEVIA